MEKISDFFLSFKWTKLFYFYFHDSFSVNEGNFLYHVCQNQKCDLLKTPTISLMDAGINIYPKYVCVQHREYLNWRRWFDTFIWPKTPFCFKRHFSSAGFVICFVFFFPTGGLVRLACSSDDQLLFSVPQISCCVHQLYHFRVGHVPLLPQTQSKWVTLGLILYLLSHFIIRWQCLF